VPRGEASAVAEPLFRRCGIPLRHRTFRLAPEPPSLGRLYRRVGIFRGSRAGPENAVDPAVQVL
jgi:hypothetical protein